MTTVDASATTREAQLFIAGEWIDSASGATFPASGMCYPRGVAASSPRSAAPGNPRIETRDPRPGHFKYRCAYAIDRPPYEGFISTISVVSSDDGLESTLTTQERLL